MQIILSQEEYQEYINLKMMSLKKRFLTKRQQAIFEFYRHNPCSTYKEASKQLGISDVAIYKHVLKMEKEGHLNRDIGGKVYISLNNLFKTVKEGEKQSN